MSVIDFDHGYWYATALKKFAQEIGIPLSSQLRKDELEDAVRTFLKSGRLPKFTKRPAKAIGPRDVDKGLRPSLRIVRYTNDKETKDFLEHEAQRMSPGLKGKSGSRYRLNRWREAQIASGVKLTYGMLVAEYVRLNQTAGSFAQIPHGRYVNFVSDFLAAEGSDRRHEAVRAWHVLKTLDAPKTYRAWVAWRRRNIKEREKERSSN